MDTSKYSSEGWWLHSGLEMQYTEDAMDWASYRGHIEVLNWWLTSGIPDLKYSSERIQYYSQEVQNWWHASGLPLKRVSMKSSRKI